MMRSLREATIQELKEYLSKVSGSPTNDLAITVRSRSTVKADALIVAPEIKIRANGEITITGSRIQVQIPAFEESTKIRMSMSEDNRPIFTVGYGYTELEFLFFLL